MPEAEQRNLVLGIGGEKLGPYTSSEVRGFIAERRVQLHDFLWNMNSPGWVSFEESEFADCFGGKAPEQTVEAELAEDPGHLLEKELQEEYARQPKPTQEIHSIRGSGRNHAVKPLEDWLGMDRESLVDLADHAEGNYHVFPIQGRSKKRWIEAPSDLLKQVQRKTLDRLLDPIPLNGAAHGFVRDRSILTHASNHVRKRWIINLDIRSFFPSVNAEQVRKVAKELPILPDDVELFVKLTTRKEHLPQGAPTSPALGNLVLRSMDRKMCDLVRGTGWFYTRYADDLTFSGFRKPREIYDAARRIVEEEGFQTSPEKCRIRGRNRRQMVTGIVVNRKLALPKDKRRMVRAMRHRMDNGLVPGSEMNHVLGWLNFSDYVNQCDRELTKRGEHVRPRIKFSKLQQIRLFIETGYSWKEVARRTEVSTGTVRRVDAYYHEMLGRSLASAPSASWANDQMADPDYLGCTMLHAVATAGRLADAPELVLTRRNMLRLDCVGRTAYGEVVRTGDEKALPEKLRVQEFEDESDALGKIFKLVAGDQANLAADLAKGVLSGEAYGAMLEPLSGHLFPAWIIGAARIRRNLSPFPKLREGLFPEWWHGEMLRAEATALLFPFLELADEATVSAFLDSADKEGATLLHYVARDERIGKAPSQFLRMDLLMRETDDGETVFDLAELAGTLERLPDELVQKWESSRE